MLFVFIYTFLCNRNHPKRKEEMEQQIPFSYVIISPENATEKEGYMISTIDKCGFFFCQKGEVEVALNDKSYLISKGSVCIYMTGSLLRIQRISKDIKGIMLEVDLNYIIPIVNKIVNSENLLYLRENPCFSITEYQYNYLEQLIKALQQRMDIKAHDIPLQRQHLISELIKSWGQTLCYELLNVYFTNQPLKPLSQDKKDKIFQNFVITLFRYYQQERDVTFYASKQYLSSRYFSAVIKEKSGSTALQWLVQMVITEAKQLLENSDLTIKEIATKLNFPTQSFFGKYFKQYVGVSPKEYRNKQIRQLPF